MTYTLYLDLEASSGFIVGEIKRYRSYTSTLSVLLEDDVPLLHQVLQSEHYIYEKYTVSNPNIIQIPFTSRLELKDYLTQHYPELFL